MPIPSSNSPKKHATGFTGIIQKFSDFQHAVHVVSFIKLAFSTVNRGIQRWIPPKCIEKSFKTVHSTFRSLEMHPKGPYKICICSVMLGRIFLKISRVGVMLGAARETLTRPQSPLSLSPPPESREDDWGRVRGEPDRGFRNYEGFTDIFPKILGAIARSTKVRIFLIPLSIKFFNPEILGFLFLRKLA